MSDVDIQIQDKDYIDQLVVALARQGYSVRFIAKESVVRFTTPQDGKVKETDVNL